MSSHEPPMEVIQLRPRQWVWVCWSPECRHFTSDEFDTHAEALEAALNHCKKANQP